MYDAYIEPPLLHTSAIFSRDVDQMYRYTLTRIWDYSLPPLVIGMLNPSTADHVKNDPTIARVVRRAVTTVWRKQRFGSTVVWNAFAFRATLPENMKAANDPVGLLNDYHILKTLIDCRNRGGLAVVGWGNHGSFMGRDEQVLRLAERVGVTLHCFGSNANGQPKHPLYVPYSEGPRPWRLAA